MTHPLFQAFPVGPHHLRNRIVMAPLTRSRAGRPGDVPTALNALYYRQRATAGLIVTEATWISPQGKGYAYTPGIHSDEQVAGWRQVTSAVHAEGGLIFLQLWHVGRVSHRRLQPDGALPVAPSAIAPAGLAFLGVEDGQPQLAPFETPRALESAELAGIVADYAKAARNAMDAGFDGVEIHAANGYLLDQFLNSTSNHRSDAYGGSIGNRARLLMEVVEAVMAVWGSDRVGVRLSPLGTFNDMGDADPEALFGAVAEMLSGFGLGYLHLVDSTYVSGNLTREAPEPRAAALVRLVRDRYRGTLLVCGGYDRPRAEAALKEGRADLVAFGRPFIANPDLPRRLLEQAPLAEADPATFYGGGARGYVDYPSLAQERGEEPATDLETLDRLATAGS